MADGAEGTPPFRIEVARPNGTRYLYNDDQQFETADEVREVLQRLATQGLQARVLDESGADLGGTAPDPEQSVADDDMLTELIRVRMATETIRNILVFFTILCAAGVLVLVVVATAGD